MKQSNNSYHAKELIDSGFLKYADSSGIDRLASQLIDSFNIYEEDIFKLAHIDAEELAEFSFDFFLPNLNRVLGKRNMTLFAQKLNDNEESLDVEINGDTIQLYTQEDLDTNSFWYTAARNFFQKVNILLKDNNNDEQFYLLYGGNDLHVMLLTEKQFSIIADYYKKKPKEIPYIP